MPRRRGRQQEDDGDEMPHRQQPQVDDDDDDDDWIDVEEGEEGDELFDPFASDDDGDEDDDDAGTSSNRHNKQSGDEGGGGGGHDLYELIGVPRDASQEDIARAYRRKALKCHPDLNPDGAELFKQLCAAYEVLSDAARRKVYDRTGETGDGDGAGVADDEAARSFEISEMLRTFMLAFRGSDEEVAELSAAFIAGKGSLPSMLDNFMWTNEEGEMARIVKLVNEAALPALQRRAAAAPAAKASGRSKNKNADADDAEAPSVDAETLKKLAVTWGKSSSADKVAALNKKLDKERRDAEEALQAILAAREAGSNKKKQPSKNKQRDDDDDDEWEDVGDDDAAASDKKKSKSKRPGGKSKAVAAIADRSAAAAAVAAGPGGGQLSLLSMLRQNAGRDCMDMADMLEAKYGGGAGGKKKAKK